MSSTNQGFPQINTPFVDVNSGKMTNTWYKFLISLWTRTGSGTGEDGAFVSNNVAITGGTIDGTILGSLNPVAGTFTTLIATGSLRVAGATPVADGTYTVGAKLTGGGTPGTITTINGIITSISQAT